MQHDGEQQHGRAVRSRRPREEQPHQAEPGRLALVALLLEVAGQVAEHPGAGGEHERQVGEQEGAGGGRREQQVARGRAAGQHPGHRARQGEGGQELDGGGRAEQRAAGDRSAAGGEEQGRGHQQGAQGVDVGVVDRPERDPREPPPQGGVHRSAAQEQQTGGGHREQRAARLDGADTAADRGEPAEPALRDRRVDGVHGGPVDVRAGAFGGAALVPAGARAAGREEVGRGGAQTGQGGVVRCVAVWREARGLHPAVPDVAVGVVAGARRGEQAGGGDGDRTGQHQRRPVPPGRVPQQRDGEGEQREVGRVPAVQRAGVAEGAATRHGAGEGRDEGDQGGNDGEAHTATLPPDRAAGPPTGPGVRLP
ncbi:hypothetical protein OG335_30970 [Kitasatospora sp. NBC_01539]